MAQFRRHNEAVLRTLKIGNLVAFERKYYTYVGVYVGMYQCLLFNCRISIFLAFFSHFIRAHYQTMDKTWKGRLRYSFQMGEECKVAYANYNYKTRSTSIFTDPYVAKHLSLLHDKYVIISTDKANTNIVFVC